VGTWYDRPDAHKLIEEAEFRIALLDNSRTEVFKPTRNRG